MKRSNDHPIASEIIILLQLCILILSITMNYGCAVRANNETGREAMDIEKECLRVANDRLIELGKDPREYYAEIRRDDQDVIVVYSLKKKELADGSIIHGGGLEIILGRSDCKIKEVLWHQ